MKRKEESLNGQRMLSFLKIMVPPPSLDCRFIAESGRIVQERRYIKENHILLEGVKEENPVLKHELQESVKYEKKGFFRKVFRETKFEKMILEFYRRFCYMEIANTIDLGEAAMSAGMSKHETSEIRNVLAAMSFIRKVKDDQMRTDIFELLSFRQMVDLVKLFEDTRENLEIPVGTDRPSNMIELTHRFVHALIRTKQHLTLKSISGPMVEENPELTERCLCA